ncbi:hypothetical protein [Phenylobacterium sp.]|jgi:hypothetical protein|uniref:hypothetical protein n=1 Tax=Phenylobacterium sp. TaxID=1871053 RepID=UPI002F3FEA11
MIRQTLLALAALSMAAAAHAQTAAPPKVERVEGVVTALTDTEITLAEANGRTETIKLLPTWSVGVARPISVEDIKPGSYLGTTNHATPDGAGVSTEVHVSPPGTAGPGLDFLMDAAAQTTMTNGVVTTVVRSEGGRVLTVNYGAGARRITVPAGVPVVLTTAGDRSLVKVGAKVRLVNFTPSGGAPRQFISVGENGAPPPG